MYVLTYIFFVKFIGQQSTKKTSSNHSLYSLPKTLWFCCLLEIQHRRSHDVSCNFYINFFLSFFHKNYWRSDVTFAFSKMIFLCRLVFFFTEWISDLAHVVWQRKSHCTAVKYFKKNYVDIWNIPPSLL